MVFVKINTIERNIYKVSLRLRWGNDGPLPEVRALTQFPMFLFQREIRVSCYQGVQLETHILLITGNHPSRRRESSEIAEGFKNLSNDSWRTLQSCKIKISTIEYSLKAKFKENVQTTHRQKEMIKVKKNKWIKRQIEVKWTNWRVGGSSNPDIFYNILNYSRQSIDSRFKKFADISLLLQIHQSLSIWYEISLTLLKCYWRSLSLEVGFITYHNLSH